ncbi:MAG: serine O-acetyltransferase [Alphaproteobacteria bacterium]
MLLRNLRDEIDATLARDPAARSRLEVVLCYPGFQALLFYRIGHWLWERGWRLAGRFVSHLGRVATGIEIHPGARIGKRLFIDHGMGVVIGETAEIGDDCTLYQDVTLGGTSLERGQKRHPTLGNDVIVSAGAQVLGPFRVGDGARIGAQAVVLKEVADGATMVGIPARPVGREPGRDAPHPPEPIFAPYGFTGEIPDPIARALNALLDEVTSLRARLGELERESESRNGPRGAAETAGADPVRRRVGAQP